MNFSRFGTVHEEHSSLQQILQQRKPERPFSRTDMSTGINDMELIQRVQHRFIRLFP